jgi:cytochrome o ubiquinol oxidase subunit 1
MPDNTAIGMIVCVCSTLLGLALVFWIWWLAILSFAVMILNLIGRTFRVDARHVIPAAEIAAEHRAWLARIEASSAVDRLEETHERNLGRAVLERPERLEAAQ